MAFDHSPFILPVRIAQGALSIIVLGLLAFVANKYFNSPSQVNFDIFASVWTLLALAYLVITPIHFTTYAHKFGILAAEAVTMIFWFAGFIALAVYLNDIDCRVGDVCGAAIAGDVFAAFEWVLFSFTTVLAAMHCYRTKDTHTKSHDPAMEVQHPVRPYPGA